jgi:hypothetical protein
MKLSTSEQAKQGSSNQQSKQYGSIAFRNTETISPSVSLVVCGRKLCSSFKPTLKRLVAEWIRVTFSLYFSNCELTKTKQKWLSIVESLQNCLQILIHDPNRSHKHSKFCILIVIGPLPKSALYNSGVEIRVSIVQTLVAQLKFCGPKIRSFEFGCFLSQFHASLNEYSDWIQDVYLTWWQVLIERGTLCSFSPYM